MFQTNSKRADGMSRSKDIQDEHIMWHFRPLHFDFHTFGEIFRGPRMLDWKIWEAVA